MEQILLAYGLPKETVAAIMILYRNTKVKVRSPDGDTEYFDIVAGVLQGDTLAPYLFIICLDYVLRTSIDKIRENGFELTKRRSKRYPAKTITLYPIYWALFILYCTLVNQTTHNHKAIYWRPKETHDIYIYKYIYIYIYIPHGRLRSGWRGGWTKIIQECWEQY